VKGWYRWEPSNHLHPSVHHLPNANEYGGPQASRLNIFRI
jgi:hypothetical protein